MSKYQSSIAIPFFFPCFLFHSPFPLGYSWNHFSVVPIESDYQRQHCRNKLTKQRISLSKAIHKPRVALLVLSLCFLLISLVWRNLAARILNPVIKWPGEILERKSESIQQSVWNLFIYSYWLKYHIFFTRYIWNNCLK